MKIKTKKRAKLVQITEIKRGECFYFKGYVGLKVLVNGDNHYIDLSDGNNFDLYDSDVVRPLELYVSSDEEIPS